MLNMILFLVVVINFNYVLTDEAVSFASAATSSSVATASVHRCRPKINVCGINEVYDTCPSPCPPRTCATKNIGFNCIVPLQPGDPNCPPPSCRCKNGFYRNDQRVCVTKEQCPETPICGENQVYEVCPSTCPPRTCATKDIAFRCATPLEPGDPNCLPPACRCANGYYSNDNGECVLKEQCPVKPTCGKNQVYEVCPSTCPPRTCATKDRAYKCAAPLEPGDPNCLPPACRCANGYYSNDNGECVLKEQCPNINCGPNEEYISCPVPTCANQTCENIGKQFSCPAIPANYSCKGECRCIDGYYRNKIGECISEEDCKKCTGKDEYFSCGGACDNKCKNLSKQNQTNCPIINIVCNRMCYCLEGYARDPETNICIPISECPPECPRENEIYSRCPNKQCRAKTCAEVGSPLPCSNVARKNTNCGRPGCICELGYVRNESGVCIPESDCPPQCGSNEVPSDCGNNPCLPTCDEPEKNLYCKPNPASCEPGCVCADGYIRNENGVCVEKNKCPPKIVCGENEEYQSCPAPTCAKQTCENIGKIFNCPEMPSTTTCKGECRCKKGFYRNKIGQCISEEDCKKCPGKYEYFSCGGACDNECINLSRQNQTNCPIVNIVCNQKCYCLEGYARDPVTNICIPISECPPECKEHEIYSNCPNGECRVKTCDGLGFPLPCLQPNNTQNSDCGEPGCICEPGYVRNKHGVCVAETECPSCGGDPNAGPGCGTFCTTCENYKEKYVACPDFCLINGCDCRPNYVYDSVTKKCILPDQCKQCKENEQYSACPNQVCRPKTCDELGFPLPCNQIPRNTTNCGEPACICKSGFARNKAGVCVKTTECPSCGGDPNAGPGCGTFCTTCDNYKDKGRGCPAVCGTNECGCRPNYVYNRVTKKCVLPDDCPPKCGDNEVPSNCSNNPCLSTCANPTLESICRPNLSICKPGCVCADGYLRNEKGVCVPKEKCPPTVNCGANEEYLSCPVPTCANQTCENIGKKFNCPNIPFNYTCVGECRCKKGFYRNKIGECISEADCKKCPGKYEYFSCGNECDNECDKLSTQSHANCPIINVKCNPMCYCLEGYARHPTSKICIPISQCPPQKCGKNEVTSSCANSPCIRNCATKDLNLQCKPYPPGCKTGCVCADGYLRDDNGVCVPIDQCPPNL